MQPTGTAVRGGRTFKALMKMLKARMNAMKALMTRVKTLLITVNALVAPVMHPRRTLEPDMSTVLRGRAMVMRLVDAVVAR